MNGTNLSELESLPDETILNILDNLPIPDLIQILRTNTNLRNTFYPEYEQEILEYQRNQRIQQFLNIVQNKVRGLYWTNAIKIIDRLYKFNNNPLSHYQLTALVSPIWFSGHDQELNDKDTLIYTLETIINEQNFDVDPNIMSDIVIDV